MSTSNQFNGYSTLFLDSRDRIEGTLACDTQIKNQLAGTQTLVRELKMTNARVNWTIPSIVSGKNTFFYDDGFTNWMITLTPGWYSYQGLAAEIQARVIAASGDATFTCTTPAFNANFNALNFQRFTFASGATNVGISRFDEPLGYTCGFFVKAATTPFTTFGRASLQYTPYIDFTSTALNRFNRNDFNTNNSNYVLNRFYISEEGNPQPSVIEFVYQNPKILSYQSDAGFGVIDIKVYDAYGNILPCSQNDGFEYVLNLFAY